MSGRTRALLAGMMVAALGLAACSGPASTAPASSSPTPPTRVGTVTDFALPDALRTATLTTSTGAKTSLAALAGKVVVLSDAMTLCQETCPMDTSSLVDAARAANAAGHQDQVVYLSVTVDPARDTVPQIAAYRALFKPVPANWMVATGSASDIAAIWKDLGVYTQKVPAQKPAPRNWRTGQPLTYDVQHSDALFFLKPNGHVGFVIQGTPKTAPSSIPTTLEKFLSDQGHQNLASPDPQAWTASDADQVIDWMLAG